MQTIRTDPLPQGNRVIPPVTNLLDRRGNPIHLDQDVIVYAAFPFIRPGTPAMSYRGKVVTIGDPGLPGREVIGVRPHGSTYRSTHGPSGVELHTFDEVAWLQAETAAAAEMGSDVSDAWGRIHRTGIDLVKCLFGGFHFETFQRKTMGYYLDSLKQTD